MSLLDRVIEQFGDFSYRHSFVESHVDSSLATQIQVLREQRKLTQAQLAEAAGMKQSQISRLERFDNSSWQLRTLRRVARALDLALVVRLESFGTVLPSIGDFGRKSLQRDSFEQDPAFKTERRAVGTVPNQSPLATTGLADDTVANSNSRSTPVDLGRSAAARQWKEPYRGVTKAAVTIDGLRALEGALGATSVRRLPVLVGNLGQIDDPPYLRFVAAPRTARRLNIDVSNPSGSQQQLVASGNV
jgi:transcriptional regulator with XRE-family HTH domain